MIRSACAYLFGVHFLFPDQPWWVAVTLVNAGMMLWLSWRPSPRIDLAGISEYLYFGVAALSSLFRASPFWITPFDFALALTACLFTFSLVPRGSHRVFAVGIGVALAGVLCAAGLADWPGYSAAAYHARIYAAVLLLGVSAACVAESWVRGHALDWRAVIAIAWFLTLFLTLVQWRTDVQSAGYWRQYWHVALAGKIAAGGCLAGWIWTGREG